MRLKQKADAFDFLCLKNATFPGPAGVSREGVWGGGCNLSTDGLLPVGTANSLPQRDL